MKSGAPRLAVADVSKRFGVVRALDGVSLDVGRGEIHALVGENGAGKSTLTRIIGGAERADAGTISFENSPQALSSPAAALAAGVSIVYQHLNLSDELTVAGNLYLGREPRRALRGGVDDRAMNRAAAVWLDRLGAEFPPEELVGDLSPSDRQLAEIARGLSYDPKLLIMDEPTASLAPAAAERVFAVLRELTAAGLSVIYITHELAHVFELADRVTVLKDGKNALSAPIAEVDREGLIRAMVGRSVTELFPPRERHARRRVGARARAARPHPSRLLRVDLPGAGARRGARPRRPGRLRPLAGRPGDLRRRAGAQHGPAPRRDPGRRRELQPTRTALRGAAWDRLRPRGPQGRRPRPQLLGRRQHLPDPARKLWPAPAC